MAVGKINQTEKQVLAVYEEENPSIHWIEQPALFRRMEAQRIRLFHDALKFPPKMFEGCELVDVGAGTGEKTIFYSLWGARCTLVDANAYALARARDIFKKYSTRPARYVAASLFDMPLRRRYDIVACHGVIHHTADKWKALNVLASLVKPGGYLLLAAGNAAGAWQRQFMRLLVYRFGTSAEIIAHNASYLFPEHIERASRLGQRSARAVIWDTYVNPKIDCLTLRELLVFCRRGSMSIYSAAPDFILSYRGDAPMTDFDVARYPATVVLAELAWLLHSEPDKKAWRVLDRSSQHVSKQLARFVALLHDVEPGRDYSLAELLKRADALHAAARAADPLTNMRARVSLFIEDVHTVIRAAADNNLEKLRRAIQQTRVLFKGTSGLGMNYYVLWKKS